MHQICPPRHPTTRNAQRGSSHLLSLCGRTWRASSGLFLSLLLPTASVLAAAQQSTPAATPQAQQPKDQQNQSIPDAPSAVQPAPPLPETPPQAAPEPQPQQAPPGPNAAPPTQQDQTTNPAPRPPINIRTVPEGGATKGQPSAQEEFYKINVITNQVVVPVTVKDESGHIVNGLTAKDFSVLENGKKQTLNFFTSDPFALSAAVVLDLGMKDVDLQKANHTFPALEGAFSQFDEVSLYTYSNAVSQLSGWGAVGQKLSASLDDLRKVRGQNNGPPVTGGPLGSQGPMINNRPVDPAAPIVYTPVQEAHVLNDAILRAAMDMAQREITRRKIIFVISDGREYRSNASYRDVLRIL